MRELHLFAGIGGGILAGEMLGHHPVCAVEIDPFCQSVLRRHWPELPIHGDIRTFPAGEWCDRVDVVAGGFPCQDISSAGKGAGLQGARSGLWFEMLRVVRDVRPSYVFVENSPLLRTRGLDVILAGLSELGFDAAWETLSAEDVGACHRRNRMWILAAHPDRVQLREQSGRGGGESRPGEAFAAVDGEAQCMADANGERLEEQALHDLRQDGPRAADAVGDGSLADANSQARRRPEGDAISGTGAEEIRLGEEESRRRSADLAVAGGAGLPIWPWPPGERAHAAALRSGWWHAEPELGRVVDGAPHRVDRLRALGNAQVPLQAATAFRRLLAAVTS